MRTKSTDDYTTPVARGRKSKIYNSDNNTIIKLYDKNFPQDKIRREYNNTLLVYSSKKLLVPRPYEIVHRGNQTGIRYERIDGISLMDLFQKNPMYYFTYWEKIAEIHKAIHRVSIDGLPTQHEIFTKLLTSSARLASQEKELLLEILEIPQSSKLCHGDFHHGNIIMTKNNSFYILDWMDAFIGDPILDAALTAVDASVSEAPPHIPVIYRLLYDAIKNLIKLDSRYIRLYGAVEEKGLRVSMLLAAGIHLANFDGENAAGHREYFDKRLKEFKGI